MHPGESLLQSEMATRAVLGIRPGLDRMARVMESLGNPHRRLGRVILVGGTNGKGSTAAFIESILAAGGYTTAVYTSPHLIRVNERVRLDRIPVASAPLDQALDRVLAGESMSGTTLTGFELATATALVLVAHNRPDFTILEVGMGGRWDATNIVDPARSVVTPVGLDHTRYLGRTSREILGEKLGITRPHVPCLAGEQTAELEEVLRAHCRTRGIPLTMAGRDFGARMRNGLWEYRGPDLELGDITLGLAGAYQVGNAALAAAVCRSMVGEARLPQPVVARGLEAARWPGRFDLRHVHAKPILLDGAHNVPAVEALVDSFRSRWSHRPTVLLGVRGGKDAAGMIGALEPLAGRFIFTRPGRSEGIPPDELARLVKPPLEVVVRPEPGQAWAELCREPPARVDLCCGSFYLVGYCLGVIEASRQTAGEASDWMGDVS